MLAIVSSDDLQAQGCVMFKQLKNRYSDPVQNKKFKVGIDRSKMRLYDVELEHQDLIQDQDTRPLMDKTDTGQRINQEKIAGKLGFN